MVKNDILGVILGKLTSLLLANLQEQDHDSISPIWWLWEINEVMHSTQNNVQDILRAIKVCCYYYYRVGLCGRHMCWKSNRVHEEAVIKSNE